MSLAVRMRELAVKLEKRNEEHNILSIEEEKEYLKKFKTPKDDMERSYFQYRCQMRKNKFCVTALLNVLSLPAILFYLLKPGDRLDDRAKCQGVFFSDGKPDNIIPAGLRAEIQDIHIVGEKHEGMTREDLKFILGIFQRYPLSWHFLLKILMKVRFYRYEMTRWNPSAIIVCNEYSFTSSAMTNYCMSNGIRHVNVMHGEKIFDMRDSFFRFDRCYVWDAHYKELFAGLRAAPGQFIIEVPESLKFPDKGRRIEKKVDYTYYLGWEEGARLVRITEVMGGLKQRGYRVAIRPHPRYTKMDELMGLAGDIQVEDVRKLGIEESLRRTRNAVSVFSTVLNQAYYNGIGVVIDDVSDPQKYSRLAGAHYIMLCKRHRHLSELLEYQKLSD